MDVSQILKNYSKPNISPYIGIQALRFFGLRIFLQKLNYHIYSNTKYLCLGKELKEIPPLAGFLDFVDLSSASSEDVELFFKLMAKENGSSIYEMLVRKNLYKTGFHNCYIGRLNDSQKMASITWLVSADDIKKAQSEKRYPLIQKDVVYGFK